MTGGMNLLCTLHIALYRQGSLEPLGAGRGKVVGVSEEELTKLQEDADRREKQLKNQVSVRFCRLRMEIESRLIYSTMILMEL